MNGPLSSINVATNLIIAGILNVDPKDEDYSVLGETNLVLIE